MMHILEGKEIMEGMKKRVSPFALRVEVADQDHHPK
jgi:hypothetical protein